MVALIFFTSVYHYVWCIIIVPSHFLHQNGTNTNISPSFCVCVCEKISNLETEAFTENAKLNIFKYLLSLFCSRTLTLSLIQWYADYCVIFIPLALSCVRCVPPHRYLGGPAFGTFSPLAHLQTQLQLSSLYEYPNTNMFLQVLCILLESSYWILVICKVQVCILVHNFRLL